MSTPLVSVILPIYKGELFIKEAIDSIINQTYQNIELLLINDKSPDDSLNIIEGFEDNRIRIINNDKNLGLIGALNIGFIESKGKYIARMDQDDISLPNRIEKQVDFMETHKDITVVGTLYQTFGIRSELIRLPLDDENIKLHSYFNSPVCHPTAMFRNSDILNYGLKYNSNYKDIEDWKLWTDIQNLNLKIANLDTVHLNYRLEGQSTTTQNLNLRKIQFSKIYKLKLSGLYSNINDDLLNLHWSFATGNLLENISVNKLNKYINQLQFKLRTQNFNSANIEKELLPRKNKLLCKLTDSSVLKGLHFMQKQKLITLANLKYSLIKMIKK
jgi:glycosyltransferase involved in cell wall biosynthesis